MIFFFSFVVVFKEQEGCSAVDYAGQKLSQHRAVTEQPGLCRQFKLPSFHSFVQLVKGRA